MNAARFAGILSLYVSTSVFASVIAKPQRAE